MKQLLKLELPEGLAGDEKSVDLIRMLIKESPDPFSREQFSPGHVTATGLVLNPDRVGIAIVLHSRLKRWLLPGGHVEMGDRSVIEAARREVWEETGISTSGGRVVGVDVHGIPGRVKNGVKLEPYHLHHDVLVGFEALGTELVLSHESCDVQWVCPEQFDEYDVPASVRRAYQRVLSGWTVAQ